MDIISKSIGIGRTIKNVSRFREIISVFAKNGFEEIIYKLRAEKKIPHFVLPEGPSISSHFEESSGSWSKSLGFRLRKSFEELGPTFIKMGQALSTREDIFDSDFIQEMKKLLDGVKGVPLDEIVQLLDKELGRPYLEVFSYIDSRPIGTASIGMVFRGELRNGDQVVIKVKRPNIEKTINTDISILIFLTEKLEQIEKSLKYLGFSKFLKDFSSHLKRELDFNYEALNCIRLKNIIERLDKNSIFYIPKVYKNFSTKNVLVLEYLEGIPFSRTEEIQQFKNVVEDKLLKGVNVFIDSLLDEGFFHADLHGGNFFLLKNEKIGVIDFGLTGNLSKKERTSLMVILYSIISYQYDNLVYEFLDVAEYENIPDADELIRDVKESLSPFVGLTVKQINLSHLLTTIIRTLSKHQIYLPREWFIIFRALMTLDGVGKSLGMDFDIFALIDHNLSGNIQKVFSKDDLIQEVMWSSKDMIQLSRIVPRHIKWFLRNFAKKAYAIEIIHTGHEKEVRQIISILNLLGNYFLAGIFFLSGTVLLGVTGHTDFHNIPILIWVMWILGAAFWAWGNFKGRESKSRKVKNKSNYSARAR